MLVAHKSWCPGLIAITAVTLVSLACELAHAQGDLPPEDWGYDADAYECDGPCTGPRTLGGHTFVPSTLVEWPFIVSRVASTTSVGFAEIDIGPQRLAMRLGIDGTDDFIFADQSVLGSVAIAPWLSLALRARGSLVVPTGTNGAVLIGEHGLYGGDATASVRVIRSGRFQASLLVNGAQLRPNSVVPARLPRSPFQEGDLTTVRPAVAIAYAFTPRFGLQASASYAWQWFDVIEEDTFRTFAGSAALTFDVRAVPLTLLLAGQYSRESGESTTMDAMDAVFGLGESNVWGEAGLVYRGIPALDLGAALDWKLDDADNNSRWFAQLRLAYYFL